MRRRVTVIEFTDDELHKVYLGLNLLKNSDRVLKKN
jgi:hypothetical protein